MRRFILYAIAALMVVGSGTVAPANLYSQGTHDPCDAFKMIIITPPKEIDFKMIIIPVPKNLDTAMVINPCQLSGSSAPSAVIVPNQTKDEPFKVPPFTIKKKSTP